MVDDYGLEARLDDYLCLVAEDLPVLLHHLNEFLEQLLISSKESVVCRHQPKGSFTGIVEGR